MPKLPKLPAPRCPGDDAAASAPGEDTGPKGPVEGAKHAGITVVDWVDERTSLSGGARWLMSPEGAEGHPTGPTRWLRDDVRVLSQAVTGVFLAKYYRPDPSGGAYESIRYVTNDVFLGQFVRGMHKWGSSVMVILIFLDMDERSSAPPTIPRSQLGHRHRPSDPDDDDVVHRLPAPVDQRAYWRRSSVPTSTGPDRSSGHT